MPPLHFTVTCPQCSRQLRLPQDALGKAVKCPLCQTAFETRERPNGSVEGIPIAPPLNPSKPEPPPPAPAGLPNLSLDDDPPPAAPPPPKRTRPCAPQDEPAEPYKVSGEEDVPEAPLIDDGRRRRRDEDEARPRRRRDPRADEDERPRRRDEEERPRRRDEEDDRPRRRRERQEEDDEDRKRKGSGQPFAVLVHSDPNSKLTGRFSAEIDEKGMRLWRGRGRVLEVPPDSEVRQLEGARLKVPIEGRDVELSVVEPHGRSLVLAEQIVAFYAGEQKRVSLPRVKKKAGPVAWLAAVPVGIPLLAVVCGHSIGGVVGGILWGVLGLIVAGVCALFVLRASWSVKSRAWLGGATLFLGYVILGCGFLFDHETLPSQSRWKEFTPAEGGFTAAMPSEPRPIVWDNNEMRGHGLRMHEAHHERAGYVFAAGAGEFKADSVRNLPLNQRLDRVRDLMTRNMMPNTIGFPQETTTNPQANVAVRDYRLGTLGQTLVARMTVRGRRVFVLCVSGPSGITRHSSEVRKFFDSAKWEPGEDGPDDGAPVDPGAGGGNPPPTENLGAGGKVIARNAAFSWAGISKDGRTVAALSEAGRVHVFDQFGTERFSLSVTFANGEKASSASFSPDGSKLAVAGLDGSLYVVPLTGRANKVFDTYSNRRGKAQWCVAWSPDGKTLASGDGTGKVLLYDVAQKNVRATLDAGKNQVLSLAYSPDGRLLAAGNADRRIFAFQTSDNRQVGDWEAHQKAGAQVLAAAQSWNYALRTLAFSPDNQTLASGGNDQNFRVWNADSKVPLRNGNVGGAVTAVAFYPTGRLLAVGTDAGQVTLYETLTGWQRGTVRQRDAQPLDVIVRALSCSSDRMVVATNTRVELYEIERRVALQGNDRVAVPPAVVLPKNLKRYTVLSQGQAQALQSLTVCANGSRFAVGLRDRDRIVTFAEASLKTEGEVTRGSGGFALSPSGTTIAVAREQGIDLYSTAGGRALKTLSFPQRVNRPAPLLAYSPDGKQIALGQPTRFPRGEIQLYDVDSGSMRSIQLPAAPVSVAVSPDGLSVAVAVSGDKLVRLYEASTGREYAGLKGHEAAVKLLAFSPDGKTLATADTAGSVRLFNTTRCREAFVLPIERAGVNGLAFSSDSTTLAVALQDKQVKLFDVGSAQSLKSLPHEDAVLGVGFGSGGNTLIAGTSGAFLHWDLRDVAELKKRPAPVSIDFDRKPAAEVPDLQPVGRVEPHLCHVVDVKNGFLLAFTRDKLCLHYSYPDLSFKGAYHTGAIVYRAALDAEKGVVFAATTDAASLTRLSYLQSGYGGKGDVHVYDVSAMRANKAGSGRLKPAATVKVAEQVRSLDLSSDGGTVVFVEAKATGQGESLGRFDARRYKLGEPLAIANLVTGVRAAPDRKALYVIGRMATNAKGFVLPIDLTTFKGGETVEVNSVPVDVEVTDSSVLLSGLSFSEIHFLDRKKADLPQTKRWTNLFGGQAVRVAGGRAYVLFNPALRNPGPVEAYDVSAQVQRRAEEVKARYQAAADEQLPDVNLTPDRKHLISTSGLVLRVGPRELARPSAVKQEAKKDDKDAKKSKLRLLGTSKDGHAGRVLAVAWSPAGQKLLSGGSDRWLLVRLVSTQKIDRQLRSDAGVCSVAWAGDDKSYVAATWEDHCLFTETAPNAFARQLRRGFPRSSTNGVAYGSDSKSILVACEKDLAAWPAAGFGFPRTAATTSPLTSVAAASDAAVAVAGGEDGQVRVYDLGAQPKQKAALKGHEGEVRCVAISSDGKLAVSGGADGKVKVWNVTEEKEAHSVDHGAVVLGVAITGDGKLAASSGIDGSVKLWDPSTGKEVSSTPADAEVPAYAVAFSADGRTLAVAAGATVRRYDTGPLVGAAPAKEQAKLQEAGRLGTFRDAAFDVKGGQLFTVSLAGSLKRFEFPAFKQTGLYKMDDKAFVSRVGLDVQKKTLHAVRGPRPIRDQSGVMRETGPELYSYDVRDLKPNLLKTTTKAPALAAARKTKLEGEVTGREFSPDGKWLYYLDAKANKLHKVDTATGKLEKSADAPKGATGLCVTPDGGTVWVVSSEDKDKGRLDRFAAADLAKKPGVGLKFMPTDVVATDGGKVCLSGGLGGEFVVALLDAEQKYRTAYAGKPKEATALCLSADQETVYLTARVPTAAPVIRTLPTKADKPTIGALVPPGTSRASAAREVVASPDGEYVIARTLGVVWKLPKK